MRSMALAAVLVTLWLASGCASGPRLPAGPGLVAADQTPPEGAAVHAAPTWLPGDRFVYQKAGQVRLPLRASELDGGGLGLVDEESGRTLLVGPEQLERGERFADDEKAGYQLDPGDQAVSWPLWVGKRWSCQFVSRAAGRADLPLIALYHCDAAERVTVPAGTFDCLRIWRRVRVAASGPYPERVGLLWYAPEIGAVARRLDDGLLAELVEFHRQR
jgi:hypothetical protein